MEQYTNVSMRNRMYKMLHGLPQHIKDNFKWDAEASWSFTDLRIGGEIVKYFEEITTVKDKIILDATASVGGNTIVFSRKFKTVHAVELNDDRKKMLDSNVKLIGLKNVVTHNGFAQNFIDELEYDVVFIDPPWGVDYKQHDTLRLELSNAAGEKDSIESIIIKILSKCNYVIAKLPRNYDVEWLTQSISNIAIIKKSIFYGRPNSCLILFIVAI